MEQVLHTDIDEEVINHTLAVRPEWWERSLLEDLRTFYHELAELGVLDDFLQEFLSDKMQMEENFEERMFSIMADLAPEAVPSLERFLLRRLRNHLAFFTQNARLCLSKKVNP